MKTCRQFDVSDETILLLAKEFNLNPYDYIRSNIVCDGESSDLEKGLCAICDGPSNNGFRYNVQYNDHEISSTKFVTAFDLLYKDKKLFSYNQYSIHVYNETIRRLRADGDLPEKDPQVYKTAQECILLYDYDKILSKYARKLEKDLEAFLS